jgi:predicted dehydrogenase
MKPVGVGVIGCGKISGQYFTYANKFPILKMVACADMNPQAAKEKATEFAIPKACSVEELLADPAVELVLNLTVPKAHHPLAIATLQAGKHTYLEKPLGVTRMEAAAIMDLAKRKNLLVGCAPDTFMGAGIQTGRNAIDEGRIGRPVSFTALMTCKGHEHWHPSPAFYYEVGGGPMFDMGPYYLTALLNLLGPVKRLAGMGSIAIPKRTITSALLAGKTITVETPDHIAGILEFKAGAIGTMIQSFATHHGESGILNVHGTEGAIQLPDPNHFNGKVRLRLKDQPEWTELPAIFAHDYGRGVGLADLADAIRTNRPFRASGDQALAVVDLMQGFLESSESGRYFEPSVKFERPAAMPSSAPFGVLT